MRCSIATWDLGMAVWFVVVVGVCVRDDELCVMRGGGEGEGRSEQQAERRQVKWCFRLSYFETVY